MKSDAIIFLSLIALDVATKGRKRAARDLGPGQFCTVTKERSYRRSGYTCVPATGRGRLRAR